MNILCPGAKSPLPPLKWNIFSLSGAKLALLHPRECLALTNITKKDYLCKLM